MFQNPLQSRELDQSDPFSSLEGDVKGGSLDMPNPYSNPASHCFPEGVNPNQHFVNPHYVQGYERSDGVVVDGYWRDGDGNTQQDLSVEDGGGYLQTNPDGSLFNNLG